MDWCCTSVGPPGAHSRVAPSSMARPISWADGTVCVARCIWPDAFGAGFVSLLGLVPGPDTRPVIFWASTWAKTVG